MWGGLNLDLTNPDVVRFIESSRDGTTNIPVTQKPRFIVAAMWGTTSGSGYSGMLGVFDVNKESGKFIGYWGGSTQSWQDWASWQSYFTSITDTNVAYKAHFSTNYATRNAILIYY